MILARGAETLSRGADSHDRGLSRSPRACSRRQTGATGSQFAPEWKRNDKRTLVGIAAAAKDPQTWGGDATRFVLRSLDTYKNYSTMFADQAVDDSIKDDMGHSGVMNRVCPGKTLAIELETAFFKAWETTMCHPRRASNRPSQHSSRGLVCRAVAPREPRVQTSRPARSTYHICGTPKYTGNSFQFVYGTWTLRTGTCPSPEAQVGTHRRARSCYIAWHKHSTAQHSTAQHSTTQAQHKHSMA